MGRTLVSLVTPSTHSQSVRSWSCPKSPSGLEKPHHHFHSTTSDFPGLARATPKRASPEDPTGREVSDSLNNLDSWFIKGRFCNLETLLFLSTKSVFQECGVTLCLRMLCCKSSTVTDLFYVHSCSKHPSSPPRCVWPWQDKGKDSHCSVSKISFL